MPDNSHDKRFIIFGGEGYISYVNDLLNKYK